MNSYAWLSALMRSNIPQNVMKTFGYKRKKNRSMTYSLAGIVASAAAAYMLRNRRGGIGQLFQNTNMKNNLQSAFNKPMATGLTEFAKEFTSGLNNMNDRGHSGNVQGFGKSNSQVNTTGASATSPVSNELITQIGATVNQPGNEQKVDELANKLIKTNL